MKNISVYPDNRMIKNSENPEALFNWMESLSDSTRLRLLRLLERRELGVVELCDILQLPQSTVSRHLKVLSEQGWLRNRSEGAAHLYRTILDELEPVARKLWVLAREQADNWATVRQDQLRLAERLKHRQANSQAFFAGAAGRWDKLRQELYGNSFTNVATLSLLPQDWIVADLGCGTGHNTAQLANYVQRVIGIDSSPAMLKAARKRLGNCKSCELLRGDLTALPLDSNVCDAAMLVLVLTYIADISAVLSEARRVTKPGGKIVIIDLLPHDRDDFRRQMDQQHLGFETETMNRMLRDSGFDNIRINPLSPEANARGPTLFVATGKRN
ncbi:MAG TPA: metalloregulator ArsR/SmtB family transcription factor [Tepidisphaeraceae bacterium]|nr:metalloregulator ArsR/SmtB family transcription factor [Tepidisphaeraceae bacterium]